MIYLFWITTIIIGILLGIFIFLIVGSIRNKAHNPSGAKKVISGIVITSLLGFIIFGWNTYSLFSSIENFDINIPNTPNTQNNTPKPDPNKNQNNQNNNSSDYFNF